MTPRILLSNDDGIEAEGLARLGSAMAKLGEVVVVAPATDHSGASHSLTIGNPLTVVRDGDRRFRVYGTPTDCVNLGFFRLLDRPPDLVVSGFNDGRNIGEDVIYSGTVAAAREGALLGRPSIALSFVRGEDRNWDTALEFSRTLAERVLDRGLPEDTLLNVNVPAGNIRGVRLTRQGRRINKMTSPDEPATDREATFWIGAASAEWRDDPLSDSTAIHNGYISVTPLHVDLTHHEVMDSLAEWALPEV